MASRIFDRVDKCFISAC